jgi:hypothetical protein
MWAKYFIVILIIVISIALNVHTIIGGALDTYTDEYQSNLENELVKIYSTFEKEFDPNIIEKLRQHHLKKVESYKDKFPDPLVDFPIRNGKCEFSKSAEAFIDDNRIKLIYNLITNTLHWCKQHDYKIPDTILYIYISDKYPPGIEFSKYPIFVFARPRGLNFPIFPDNTFNKLSLHAKYRGKAYNWDKIKKKIISNDDSLYKRDIMYFHGSNTTNKNHNMRKILEDFSKANKVPMEIHLDAWKNYEPIWNFTKYKYLLNLPGRYPWSNRLKYLLLMNSIVINISVKMVNIDGTMNEPWISFIDYLVEPNQDYIDIPYIYYRADNDASNEDKKRAELLKQEEDKKLCEQLVKTYHDIKANPKKYDKMVEHANTTTKELSLSRVYKYIYEAIKLNSKYVK